MPAPVPLLNEARCQLRGHTLYIDGEINEKLVTVVEALLKRRHLLRIELNSFGGVVSSGRKLAQLIRKRGLATNVRDGARCSSICTLVFQAGVRRTAASSAQFVYHGARLMSQGRQTFERQCETQGRQSCLKLLRSWKRLSLKTTQQFFKEYVTYGASPLLYKEFLKQPFDSNWYDDFNLLQRKDLVLSASAAIEYGIVQALKGYPPHSGT